MPQKGNQTKNRIIVQAKALFEDKGFKNVTMKDICEATGLSRGGLYRHYQSTAHIFSDILDHFLDHQQDLFSKSMGQEIPAPTILQKIFAIYKAEMLDTKGSLSIAIMEYFSSQKENLQENALALHYHRSYLSWKTFLAYGMQRDEFRQVDPKSIYDLLIFSYQGVRMYSQLMPIPTDTPDRILELITQCLLKEAHNDKDRQNTAHRS